MQHKPIIMAVDDDPEAMRQLHEALRRRYEADYEVLASGSAAEAFEALVTAKAAGKRLALIIADHGLGMLAGMDVLDGAHGLFPDAQRALLADWGDQTASPAILEGCAFGRLENYLLKPWSPAEVHLYPAVGAFLADYARRHGPRLEFVRVVGREPSPRLHEVIGLLSRSGVAHGVYLADTPDGKALLDHARAGDERLPVVTLVDGRVLVQPTNAEIMDALGASNLEDPSCDVAIVGGGPAGLAAAVYAASEGLRTVVIEREAIGGQAGTSALIRNYLGFPRGLSGAELAQRAHEQAWLFGAKFVLGREATALSAQGDERVLRLSDGGEIRARTVIIAAGVNYRRLGIPSLERFTGAGLFYTAPADARPLRGKRAIVVGGGNSAGQTVVHLARNDCRVVFLVRGDSLARSMSDYLVQEVGRLPNVEILFRWELEGGEGEGVLERVTIKDRANGATRTLEGMPIYALIGSQPRTDWLGDAVLRNDRGFIITGSELNPTGAAWPLARQPWRLETSMPGVFAVGDVRFASVKRVASAAGEGAVAMQFVQEYLRKPAAVTAAGAA